MKSQRVKIKEIARELGVSVRELAERCRAEGLAVQNSVSRLPVQEERIVRGWFEGGRDKESE